MDRDDILRALVKPLEWEAVDAICTRMKAPALGGHYSAVEFDANTDEAYFAANIDLGGLAFVFILEPDPLGGRRPKHYPTLAAAQAAAEADYRARIAAALDLGALERMVEAAEKLAQTMADMLDARDVIRNLSALGYDSLWGEVNTFRHAASAFRGQS